MATTRTVVSLGPVAVNAVTTIPPTPVAGTPYRNEAYTQTQNEDGERFDTIPDSADFNQKQYIISFLTDVMNSRGLLGWTDLVDYTVPSVLWGSDGLFYLAQLPSGPSTAPQDPVSTVGYWKELDTTNDLEIAAIASAVTTYTDSGAADAYVLTGVGPASPDAYVEGMRVTFYANFTGTGAAATINVNGIGVIPLLTPGLTNPLVNAVRGGTWTQVFIQGANAILVDSSETLRIDMSTTSPPTGASLIGVDAGAGQQTLSNALITGIPVAQLIFEGNGGATIIKQYGIASLSRIGQGIYEVTLVTTLSGTNYSVFCGSLSSTAMTADIDTSVHTTSVFRVRTVNAGNGAVNDGETFYVKVYDLNSL